MNRTSKGIDNKYIKNYQVLTTLHNNGRLSGEDYEKEINTLEEISFSPNSPPNDYDEYLKNMALFYLEKMSFNLNAHPKEILTLEELENDLAIFSNIIEYILKEGGHYYE